ncbi:pectinesterase QRT1-like [Coffea arabica]|uniref:Pectinesterase n=1 Tax=Coffea arabica TaxID=13443 RepID=A0A6P6S4F4_COFAR|nr:pectinesterase QRT1-like [Coffea arabica]
MMNLSCFSTCGTLVLLVLLFWGDVPKGPSKVYAVEEFEKHYIEWDDLTVADESDQGLDLDQRKPSKVIVVDKNGGGDSVTVQGAVDLVPEHNQLRHKIYILPGIYREKVRVPKSKPYVSFIGEEGRASETVITWHDKASDKDADGNEIGTFGTASVTVESDYFGAREVTFENSVVAIPGTNNMQAVALRLKGDKAWLYRVRILGTQDTLLDESGLHFYEECFIQGSVDFIFGNAKSLYRDCILHSVANGSGAIAANHRDTPNQDSGFSFVHCQIKGTGRILLGRAWGNYSKVAYSFCDFDDIIAPEGWSDWNSTAKERTVEFGEFRCRGKGAGRRNRVAWSKSFSFYEALPFLTTQFIHAYQWLLRR